MSNELPEVLTLGHPQLAQPSVPVDLADINTTLFQERLAMLESGLKAMVRTDAARNLVVSAVFFDADPSGRALGYWINPELRFHPAGVVLGGMPVCAGP
ncbi:MAG: hypothetical protein Ct9H300mP14_12720 [Gammaproteobacteria bacterium]|nr:MAG: hypothetical protein Ct9H300mP14_12720 [Gammaproteobacteria bacterium]